MNTAVIPYRTFGDLLRKYACGGRCAFCKDYRADARKYSVRHSICTTCIEPRKDVVLPRVRKREAFRARMDALAKSVT